MKYFKSNQVVLTKYIDKVINQNKNNWSKTHPWAEDSLNRLAEYATRGKMIRGILILLSAGAKNKHKALPIAAAMELMHSGILIHDDIMDRDLKRRGLPTIHTQYKKLSTALTNLEQSHFGESMASCVGIIAYFIAMSEFAKITKNKKLIELFGAEMARLGAGQMEDVDTATHFSHMSEESALRVYEQKTGRYTFAVPLLAGLIIAGRQTKTVEKNVYALAKELGIIFQLQDDVLGVVGDTNKTGKSVGGDIRERKQTWLYFKVLKSAQPVEMKQLQKLYSSGKSLNKINQRWVLDLMVSYSVLKLAQSKLLHHHAKASRLLQKLPFNKTQLKIMKELLDYLVIREK